MNRDTVAWIRFAEESYCAAVLLIKSRARRSPNNVICFYSHQCVERYLKCRLTEGGANFGDSKLISLFKQTLGLEPSWCRFVDSVTALKSYTADFLYPGHVATRDDARAALKICRSFRKEARLALGLAAK
mgnify:CR=1 FL=1